MKNFIFGLICLFTFVGCAQLQNLDPVVFGGLSTPVCDVSCAVQDFADKETCSDICYQAADIGKGFACKDSKGALSDGVIELTCSALCSAQSKIPVGICTPVCKFLAKTSKTAVKSCMR